jgi:hypothetical protein
MILKLRYALNYYASFIFVGDDDDDDDEAPSFSFIARLNSI